MPEEITFQGTVYSYDFLLEIPAIAQAEIFNKIADELSFPHIIRFADRQNGAVRVWARLKEWDNRLTKMDEAAFAALAEKKPVKYDEPVPENFLETQDERPEETKPTDELNDRPPEPKIVKAAKAAKKSVKSFNFPLGEIKEARKGTLRWRVLQKMKAGGLTFEQIVTEVVSFDKERLAAGQTLNGSDAHPERRAYEIARIIHYNLGYGMRQGTDGVITVFETK